MMKRSIKRMVAIVLAILLVLTSAGPMQIWDNLSVVEAAGAEQEWLSADEAYVAELEVKSIMDGVAPFDGNDDGGNDSSASNLRIRSYDTLKYSLEYSMETYAQGDSFKNGYIWFEVDLPYTREQAYFDTGVMNWMSTADGYKWTVTENDDGTQKLKCAKKLTLSAGNATSIPGKGTVEIVVQVRGMKNGDTIQPTFYAYMDYNEAVTEGDTCPTHNTAECKKTVPNEVIVTTAPSYNIQLKAVQDIAAYKQGTWDFSTGNELALNKDAGSVDGRIVAYAVTVQLYNTETNKGIKGIEYPEGPITFDIDMASTYLQDNNTSTPLTDSAYIPLVWSYGPSSFGESMDGRDLSGTYGSTYLEAPLNSSGNTLAQHGALANSEACEECWNGGTWRMVQNGRKLSVTISDYEINPNWFPTKNVSSLGREYAENKNIGCFSAGELFIVVPYGEGNDYVLNRYGSGTIQLNLTDSNMSMTSQTGTTVTTQANTTDDVAAKVVSLTTPGDYTNRILYGYAETQGIGYREDATTIANGDCNNNGRDISSIGSSVAILWGGVSNGKSDDTNRVEAGDFLLKFDDEALAIDDSKSISTYDECLTGTHTYYYAVKPDRTGWTDDDEMERTNIEDLRYYPTLAEAEQHGVCVGILWSFRCDHSEQIHDDNSYWYYHLNNQDTISKAYFKIKNDTSLIGKVYQTVPVANIWRANVLTPNASGVIDTSAIPTPYDVQVHNATQPETPLRNVKNAYQKSEYDEYGNYTGGHTAASINGWEYGDSLYMAGYLARINKNILQKDENNATDKMKSIYDLDAGQNIVDYELAPYINLSANVEWPNPTTMTIVDTLPVGVEYVDNSAVRGATYRPGTNGMGGTFVGGTKIEPVKGTTMIDGVSHVTLTWTINNVAVEYEQPSIYYKTEIQGNVENEQHFSNTVTVSTTEDTRPHTTQNGNMDSVGFSVVKLSNMSITKRAVSSIVDVGDELVYDVIWSNNSNSVANDEVLLDILPQNGKGLSEYDGGYELGDFTVTSVATYEVYYTTDEAVFGTKANQYDFGDITAGSSNGIAWKKATVTDNKADFGTDNGSVTAWAVLVDVPAANKVSVRNTLIPTDNKPTNVYYNRASLDEITTSAPITVAGRELSGTTWIDKDFDGIREDGETLLKGVTVKLYDANNQVVQDLLGNDCTVKTDAEGNYSFKNLPAGEFKVVFTDGDVQLDDYFLTIGNEGSDDTIDSDAVSTNDGDPTISDIDMPQASEMTEPYYKKEHLDAGFYPQRVLAGTTWVDADKDGVRENGEQLLSGVTVTLYDAQGNVVKDIKNNADCTMTTDADGNYRFENLPPGEFKVVFTDGNVTLGDYKLTVDNQGDDPIAGDSPTDSDATAANGENPTISGITIPDTSCEVLHQDAGFYPTRALAGTTWIDEDKDGIREDGEQRLPGVTVTVYDSEGHVLKDLDGNDCKKVTDSNGDYRFDNLPSGTFKVVFTDSEGVDLGDYELTVPNATDADTSVNSDATIVDGNPTISDIVMPDSSGQILYQDAGFYPQRVLAGTTWIDDNRDGERQDNEARMPGVTVTVYDDQGVILNDLNGNPCQMTTSITGDYRFEDLPSGTFKVVFTDGNNVTLGDYTLTVPNATGVDASVNSDAVDAEDGPTISDINMPTTSGEVLYQDAGFYPNRELSGTTWIDSDEDGVREDGEPRLPGVTVTLYDGNGDVVKDLKEGKECVATTDENGNYAFENLPPGNFKVVFTDGDGVELGDYTLTQKDAESDDAVDSDAATEDNKPTISGIIMPTTSAEVTHQDAGFYPAVNRVLAGTTWIDADADGERENGEDRLPGVTVTVYDEQGNIVKDLYGNECQMSTNTDGDYRFENLPSGTFKVVFTDENGVGLESYNLTVSNATGVDADVNSDAVVKNGNPTISDIVMPKNEEITGTTYEVLNQDAGFYPKRTLSGKTWIDLDKDGVREDGEPVLPGVTVTLYDENGNVVKNLEDGKECITKTDANGDYNFENLPSGTVKVEFTDGEGVKLGDYTLTQPDAGTDDVDSDAMMQGDNPSIPDINMPTSSGDVTHQDAGFYPSVNRELSGTTWIDEDNDGIRDTEEPVLPGVTVTVYDENGNVVKDLNGKECKQETDENGNYHFEYLPSGTFDVVFTDSDDVKLDDYTLTVKDAGTDDEVDSEAVVKDDNPTIPDIDMPDSSGEVTHQDAGFNYNRVLEGTTWVDNDKDGIRDANEPALPGVTVTIYDENGNVVKDLNGKECTTKTDENGDYRFENLPPGTFTIVFTDGDTKLSDYTLTDSNKGDDDTVDNDATSGSDNPTIPGVVMPDKSGKVSHQDAGFYPTVNRALAGTTWVDSNKDGKRDAGEKVLPGVTVTLYDENGNVVKNLKDGKECVTKTDANGNYRFENLPSGTFKVVFTDGDTKLGDYTLTVANAGGDDTKDSDATSVNGASTISGIEMPKDEAITGSTYEVLYQDAGFYPNDKEDEDKPKDDEEDDDKPKDDGDEDYDGDDEQEEEDVSEEADTGDHSPIRFLLILMLLSSLGFIIAFIARRKEYDQ